MAGSLHGSARTTPRVRAELQASQEKTGTLARRYGLSRTTVTKWRARTTTDDAPMGPSAPHSTVLTAVEEAMIVEFRRRTLLPLDDVLGCLRDSIPKLTRSSLHRCLERHAISRLPESSEQTSKRGKFAKAAIGYVHIDISELRLAQGKLNMFLAIDRVSKFTYVEFRDDGGKMNGAEFLRSVIDAFPYAIHTVLTDNGMAFADLPNNRNGPTRRYLGAHIFDRVCEENGIEHKLTKPYHPWTNGQAERMNRTVKEATTKVFHYPDLESLKAHVLAFVSAYNFAKHLKAIKWKTPFEAVCQAWTNTPDIFKLNPRHLIPGPNMIFMDEVIPMDQAAPSGPGRERGDAEMLRIVLERELRSGRWAPGEKLPTERDMCERYGVARNTIRRALQTLEDEHLIIRHVGRGTFRVDSRQSQDKDAFQADGIEAIGPADVMECRLLFEPELASLVVARASQSDLDTIAQCLKGMDAADTVADFEHGDNALHDAIAVATHNQAAISVVRSLAKVRLQAEWGALKARGMTPERKIELQRQHYAIVAAFRQRDKVEARTLLREHILFVQAYMFGE